MCICTYVYIHLCIHTCIWGSYYYHGVLWCKRIRLRVDFNRLLCVTCVTAIF